MVVPEKRKLMVVGAAIAAAFVLTGCAPAGVNAADYGDSTEPASETAASPGATADPSATADPVAGADPDATAPPGSENATEVGEDQVTSALTGTAVKRMGEVVENEDGAVLYRFDGDKNNPAKATCDGDCAKVWKPALTNDGKPTLKGVETKLVGTVTRTDGTKQLTVKGWPLYTYVGDHAPGDTSGEGIRNFGGVWYALSPSGQPVRSGSSAGSSSSGSSGGGYGY